MKGIIFKLLKPLATVFLSSATALIAFCFLFWFIAPRFGLTSTTLRLAIIGVVVFGYGLVLLMTSWRAKKRGQQFTKQLGEQSEDPLQPKLDEVLKALKSSPLGRKYRGDGALYALPWYMIIGPSAAGKSTLFSRSGLNFPLADDKRFQQSGIAGTKDCDWWFSDQAILIDTAGRYTQEEETEDWSRFLDILKKNRPKLPVNGVILALPIDELLLSSDVELRDHVIHSRNRLHEITDKLGVTVPIYIVLTKCDQLTGFDAFFSDLSEPERKQPWGLYLLDKTEDKSADAVEVIREKFALLHERLLDQSLQKMILATRTEEKSAIYQFPENFNAASSRMIDFVKLLFQQSPYHEQPWFAGIYFTSSLQDGAGIQVKSQGRETKFQRIKRSFTEPQEPTPFFIGQFFSQVVLPLQHAVRGNRKVQRMHRWAKTSLAITLMSLVGLTAVGLTGTYAANQLLLSNYEKRATDAIVKLQGDHIPNDERLGALIDLHDHYESLSGLQTYSPIQWIRQHDLILTHGEPMLSLLLDTMDEMLTTSIAPVLNDQFVNSVSQWASAESLDRGTMRATYYEQLALVLMLGEGYVEYFESERVSFGLSTLWWQDVVGNSTWFGDAHTVDDLRKLIDLHLQHRLVPQRADYAALWQPSLALVDEARDDLAMTATPESLYSTLVQSSESRFRPISLDSISQETQDQALLSTYQFPGMYSRSAWESFVAEEIDRLSQVSSQGDWVLGVDGVDQDAQSMSRVEQQLRAQVRARYFTDYVQHWRELFASMSSPAYTDLNKNIQAIKSLADAQGSLAILFTALEHNLTLTELASTGALGASVSDLAGDQIPKLPIIPSFEKLSEDLLRLTADSDDSGVADVYEQYLAQMQPLATELEQIAVAANRDDLARRYAGELLSGQGSGKQLFQSWIEVNNQLTNMPEKSRSLVERIYLTSIQASWRTMLVASEKSLQQAWLTTVYEPYSTNLRGRFPFSESGIDATVVDFDALLKPNQGQLWSFVENELSPFVRRDGSGWTPRTWLGQGLSFDQRLFASLNGADRLVKSLYRDSSSAVMTYWVYPVPVAGVAESRFEVDQNVYRYRNEPQEWREFQWSLDNSQRASIELRLHGGSGIVNQEFSGPWSLFRLIQAAKVEHVQGTEFLLNWSMEQSNGSTVSSQFKLRADRQGSILNPSILSTITLPQRLFRG